jgi:translation initiation factor IF-1
MAPEAPCGVVCANDVERTARKPGKGNFCDQNHNKV